MSLSKGQIEAGNSVLSSLLCGAQFDSFHVYNLELAIGFVGGAAASAWISTNQVVSADIYPTSNLRPTDFRDGRREVLGKLYSLVGCHVAAAWIGEAAELVIEFENQVKLLVIVDDEEDEILWSVTSDSPSPFVPHDWSVLLLTKKMELIINAPS